MLFEIFKKKKKIPMPVSGKISIKMKFHIFINENIMLYIVCE